MRALHRNERGRRRGKCVNFAARARSSGINHSMFPVFADIHLPTRPPVTPGLDFPSFSLHSAREKVTPRSCARRWPQKNTLAPKERLIPPPRARSCSQSVIGKTTFAPPPRPLVLPTRRSARFTCGAAATLRGATRSTAAHWASSLRAFAASRDVAFSRPPLLAALLLSVGFPPIPVTTIFRGVAMLTSGDAGVRVRASRGVVCVGSGEGVHGPAAR